MYVVYVRVGDECGLIFTSDLGLDIFEKKDITARARGRRPSLFCRKRVFQTCCYCSTAHRMDLA